jgi:release factor glutamine methyltransferase
LSTISQALHQSVETLEKISDSPNLDAQILLASTLEKPRSWIISHPEYELSPTDVSLYQAGIKSLVQGKPLPYIVGKWEFYGLDFFVTPDTLIPRPETELVVELALESVDLYENHRLAADIGTGSGCIAVALAKNSPELSIIASDISLAALNIARKNAVFHELDDRIYFLQSDLLPALSVQFDIICANLPYIPSKILPTLNIYGREPGKALNGGLDGLDQISQLLASAPDHLKPGATLLIEIDSSQGKQVQYLSKIHFPSARISLHKDLAQHDRIVKIQLPYQHKD